MKVDSADDCAGLLKSQLNVECDALIIRIARTQARVYKPVKARCIAYRATGDQRCENAN